MSGCMIGDFEVRRVEEKYASDSTTAFVFPSMAPGTIERNGDWLVPNFFNVEKQILVISIHSWLIKTGRHNILIDTCGGNHKNRPHFPEFHNNDTQYLENLKAAGCRPEDIDYVFCTHLHIDHCGWNTRLENGRWVPTFPKAKHLFSKTEYETNNPEFHDRAAHPHPEQFEIFEDSVLPVVAAGLAQIVDGTFELNENFTLEPAPGHTAGHCLVRATSRGVTGIFSGDAFHHPLQIADPELTSVFCTDPAAAIRTRRRIFEDCAEHNHLLLPAHFGAPHFGRVGRRGDGYVFHPGA